MYVIDFMKRLFKKNNVGTIIYLCMNMVMYIALLGGFALPEMIPMAIFLYLIPIFGKSVKSCHSSFPLLFAEVPKLPLFYALSFYIHDKL